MNKKNIFAVLPLLLVVALTGCSKAATVSVTEPLTSPSSVSSSTAGTPSGSTVMDALDKLTVADEAHADTYDRKNFNHWTKVAGSSCDTRFAVLQAESTTKTKISGCTIISGTWLSSYDGKTVTDPSDLDIDHMVPLKEAWRSGAYAWDAKTREAYANDLSHDNSLVAVTAASNRSKSDNDPAGWLPTLKESHCTYVANWVDIKTRWKLSVDSKEKTAIKNVLSKCDSSLSVGGSSAVPTPVASTPASTAPVETSTPSTSSAPATQAAPVTSATGGNDPKFSSCKEAIAAGYGNYTATDPEYAWYRDGDGDGKVCEK